MQAHIAFTIFLGDKTITMVKLHQFVIDFMDLIVTLKVSLDMDMFPPHSLNKK
jgi:hypothetical protein